MAERDDEDDQRIPIKMRLRPSVIRYLKIESVKQARPVGEILEDLIRCVVTIHEGEKK